jgi:fatty acid desaturase
MNTRKKTKWCSGTIGKATDNTGKYCRDSAMTDKITHTELLQSLPTEMRESLTQRSDRVGLGHLALHLGAICLTSLGIAAQVPYWPVLMLPQGILLAFLFTLSHECTHQTPFASRWINEATGHLCAVLAVLPFVWFRYYHLAHHKFTNDPDRDPELQGGDRPATYVAWLIYLSGWGYWRGMITTLVNNALGRIDSPYLPSRRHHAMRIESRVLLVIYGLVLVSLWWSPVLLWLWLAPMVIGQPFLRAYLLAEHGLCPPVANMLENSRTTYTNRLIRKMAWNMPYHAEHHAFPNVPFHQLPTLHAQTAPHLLSTSDGYADFTTEYFRQLER